VFGCEQHWAANVAPWQDVLIAKVAENNPKDRLKVGVQRIRRVASRRQLYHSAAQPQPRRLGLALARTRTRRYGHDRSRCTQGLWGPRAFQKTKDSLRLTHVFLNDAIQEHDAIRFHNLNAKALRVYWLQVGAPSARPQDVCGHGCHRAAAHVVKARMSCELTWRTSYSCRRRTSRARARTHRRSDTGAPTPGGGAHTAQSTDY
jgi:hypothetical protein